MMKTEQKKRGERYVRAPEHDRRISRGDDFAGGAWLDTVTGEIVYGAVGYDKNLGRFSDLP